jgi:hypothetical protein
MAKITAPITSLIDDTHYQIAIVKTFTYGQQQIVAGSETFMTGAMIKTLTAMPEFTDAFGDISDMPEGVTF